MTLLRTLNISFVIFCVSYPSMIWVTNIIPLDKPGHRYLVKSLHEIKRINISSSPDSRELKRGDVWGNSYVLNNETQNYYSLGANGLDENGGGDDITGPNKKYQCENYSVNCEITIIEISALILLAVTLITFIVCVVLVVILLIRIKRKKSDA